MTLLSGEAVAPGAPDGLATTAGVSASGFGSDVEVLFIFTFSDDGAMMSDE